MRRRLLTLLVLGCLANAIPAIEIGGTFDLSNLDFSRDRESTATGLPGDTYLWGITAFGEQQLSDQLALELRYTNDPVLRNLGYTLLTYTDQFFSLRIGPFFGLFNSSDTILQSGLSTTVELFVPGIATFTLRSDNSLSGRLVVSGDYIQEQSELSVGFFAPNVLPTLYARTKRYTYKTDLGENIDSFAAYGLETDIFQKNIPYRIVLDFGYQSAGRTFVEAATVTQTYGAIVLGLEAAVTLFDAFTLTTNLQSSIYVFGTDDLVGQSSADQFLFRLSTGLSYQL